MEKFNNIFFTLMEVPLESGMVSVIGKLEQVSKILNLQLKAGGWSGGSSAVFNKTALVQLQVSLYLSPLTSLSPLSLILSLSNLLSLSLPLFRCCYSTGSISNQHRHHFRRKSVMQPENSPVFSSLDQLLAGNGLSYGFPAAESLCSSSFDTMEFSGKADDQVRRFAASESHKEAERKRRERINGHLDRLRALLLCNSKTDKASLLAKVVERVRELKQQTSEIMQSDPSFPTESDEITVDTKSVVKASICCEDRVDLLPDLIEILKSLPLSPLRAEIVTLGGRIRNVIVLAGDEDQIDDSALLLRDALRSLILRSNCIGGERLRKRRMFD